MCHRPDKYLLGSVITGRQSQQGPQRGLPENEGVGDRMAGPGTACPRGPEFCKTEEVRGWQGGRDAGPEGPRGLAQPNTPPEARSPRAPHTGLKQVTGEDSESERTALGPRRDGNRNGPF